ncbi:MAG: GxxExxY protein, partial [Terrimicrobiaceae bacterium]|nr:GxxExxY protein [Terrimicrobiaceae bacterium]
EQAPLDVTYKGRKVGEYYADFLIDGPLLLEIKSVTAIVPAHEVQLVNYLAATGIDQGLLINFGAPSLEVRKRLRTLPLANPVNPVNPVESSPLGSSVKTSPPRAAAASAFTLLELLVAMAVLAILVVMMMGLVTSATTLWRQSENRADAFREARAAMTVIARDLANLVPSTNTNLFLLNNAGAFDRVPPDAEKDPARAGAAFFLAALPSNAQEPGSLSDVCEVGYFLGFERTRAGGTNSQHTLNLYRFFRPSNPAFSNFIAGTNFSGAAIGPAGEELLARNIREFRITPLLYSNNAYSTNFTPSTNKPVPDALEISITAVNQEAARRFTSKAEWTSASPPAALTNAQQIFTTRVRLNQPPPAP